MSIKSNAVKGFTLIEMMMTLSIGAILLTVAVPSYNTFTKNNQVTKQLNLLAAAVSASRGEAAKRGARVVMCQSSDPVASSPACSGTSGVWSSGWVIFVDSDNDATIDAGETVVNVFQSEPGVFINTSAGTSLTFNSDGTTTVGGSVNFYICDDRGVSHGKQLTVSGTGRPGTSAASACS